MYYSISSSQLLVAAGMLSSRLPVASPDQALRPHDGLATWGKDRRSFCPRRLSCGRCRTARRWTKLIALGLVRKVPVPSKLGHAAGHVLRCSGGRNRPVAEMRATVPSVDHPRCRFLLASRATRPRPAAGRRCISPWPRVCWSLRASILGPSAVRVVPGITRFEVVNKHPGLGTIATYHASRAWWRDMLTLSEPCVGHCVVAYMSLGHQMSPQLSILWSPSVTITRLTLEGQLVHDLSWAPAS